MLSVINVGINFFQRLFFMLHVCKYFFAWFLHGTGRWRSDVSVTGVTRQVAMLDVNQRVERIVVRIALQISEIRQHVERVEINQQIFIVSDGGGAVHRSRVESDLVTQIRRQCLLNIVVREVECFVEQTIRPAMSIKRNKKEKRSSLK